MSDKIRVAIKVRPLVSREVESGEFWRVEGNELLLLNNNKLPTGEKFAFDHVFGKLVTNVEVFEEVVKPLVDQAVKGFNATIFAYGQTSSGKTHTMLGDNNEAGITQLAVSTMFDFMKKSEGREFLVRASYMEIYNEKVNDLLEQQNKNLKIREEEGKIVVDRLKEELVAETAKVMTLLKRGQKIRRIGETNLNERSSRSHTIFRMIIESRFSDNGEDGTIQVSQLNLVDLAGSERTGLAGTSGERLKEGCAINRSLFQLSQVVSQLSEGSQFVNFRDSKLTRILQSSLGGNAHTLIICTVTPASVEFTLSTLGFASRAKAVKNKPQVNEVMSDGTLLKKYARQLEKLQAELKAAKGRNAFHELEEVENKLEEQERLNSQLQLRINNLMKTLIVAERATKPRLNRRRTWGGQMMALEFAKGHLSSLGTIQEVDTSLVLTNEDFNTPYEDFEVQLLEDEGEKCSELDVLPNTESSFNSIESSILSNRASITSRNGSLSTHKVCKEDTGVQTSTSFPTTPVRLDMATNTPPSVLRANASYWQKEYSELNSFKNHESEIILDLENQLNLKKKESEELQKALAEKEEILKNTLTFQESLTQKLVEYDHALENSRKEKDVYSEKFEKFKKDNKDLENQIEELKIQNKVCENQLAAFREILFKEVTSLNPRHANQITETSEPNEIINILMNCIMEKQMEIVSQLKRSSEHLDNNILKKDNSHQETENCHKDELEIQLNSLQQMIYNQEQEILLLQTEAKLAQDKDARTREKWEHQLKNLEKLSEDYKIKLQKETEERLAIQMKLKELTNKEQEQENLNVNTLFLEDRFNEVQSEKNASVNTFEYMDVSKEDLEEKVDVVINETSKDTLNVGLHCNRKMKSEEDIGTSLRYVDVHTTHQPSFSEEEKQIKERGNRSRFQNQEDTMEYYLPEVNESVLIMKQELEPRLTNLHVQTEATRMSKEFNISQEPSNNSVYEHMEKNHSLDYLEKLKLDYESKLQEVLHERSLLQTQVEDLSNKLLAQEQVNEKTKETIVEQINAKNDRCNSEAQLSEKKVLLGKEKAQLEPQECDLKEGLQVESQSTIEEEAETELKQMNIGEQEEKILALMEKIKTLEDQLKQGSLQKEQQGSQQIERLEKENMENTVNLKKDVENKNSLEAIVKEQKDFNKEKGAKCSLEQHIGCDEIGKKFLFHTEEQTNVFANESIQMDNEILEHQKDNLEVLQIESQNIIERKLQVKEVPEKFGEQERLSTLLEKISTLEHHLKQASLQKKELQQQIEKSEEEKVENAMNLEKVLKEKRMLEEKLEDQNRAIQDAENTKHALEDCVCSIDIELREKRQLLLEVERRTDCARGNVFFDQCVQTDLQLLEHQECNFKEVLQEEFQNITEGELQVTDVKEKFEEQLLTFMEKINVLEDQLKQDSLQKEELQLQIGKLEKEMVENTMSLGKALENKSALEAKVEEQQKIIKEIEAKKPEQCISCIELEKRHLPLKIEECGNLVSNQCVQTEFVLLQHQKENLERDLHMVTENIAEDGKEERMSDNEQCALMEKINLLEDKSIQATLEKGSLQNQIEMLEKEKAENALNLEKVSQDKFSLQEKLDEANRVIKDTEETRSVLEQCASNFEIQLKEKTQLILEMEAHICKCLSRNAYCDQCLQTDPESMNCQDINLEENLQTEFQIARGKIKILEHQLKEAFLLKEELQLQIEKLIKEKAENALCFEEKVLQQKMTLGTKHIAQNEMIKNIEEEKCSFVCEDSDCSVDTELNERSQFLFEIQHTSKYDSRTFLSNDSVHTDVQLMEPKMVKAVVHVKSENATETELHIHQMQKKLEEQEELLSALMEKISTLEYQLKQDSLQKEELQQQVEKLEKEKMENAINLEKALQENISLEAKVKERGILITDMEENGVILQNCISNLETELNEKRVLLLEFQKQKDELENQICHAKGKCLSSIQYSEHAKELEMKLIAETECRREKELELSHLQKRFIEQEEQLSTLATNEKMWEDQLKLDVLQKEEMQHKMEQLEKIRLDSEVNIQKALEEKMGLQSKIEEQNRIIKEIEESKHTLLLYRSKLESELIEKKTVLLEIQEQRNEIEKHNKNLEETLQRTIQTFECVKAELENKLKVELECRMRQEKDLGHSMEELMELKQKLSASTENFKILEDELKQEVSKSKDMKSQINELEKLKLDYEIKLKGAVDEKQFLEAKIMEQMNDFENLKMSFQQKVFNLEKDLNNQKNLFFNLEKHKSSLEDRHALLESKIENLEREKYEIEEKLNVTSNCNSDLKRELTFMQKKLSDKEIMFNNLLEEAKDLEEQLKRETELEKEMHNQLTILLEFKSNCEEQLNVEIKQRENIASKLNELTVRCTQQERTIKELENNKASLEEQLHNIENDRSMEEVVKILKIQRNEEVLSRENLKKDLMRKEDELVQCKMKIQELNNNIDTLQFNYHIVDQTYQTKLKDLETEKMKHMENSTAQSINESKLKHEIQYLQQLLSEQGKKLIRVQEQLRNLESDTKKDLAFKQELQCQIQSLEKQKMEFEMRLKKECEERKHLQLKVVDLNKRTVQHDETVRELDQAKIVLAEMMQSLESKVSWNGNETLKEIVLRQLSDLRKVCQENDMKIQSLTTERDSLVAEITKLKQLIHEQERISRDMQNSSQSQKIRSVYLEASHNESLNYELKNLCIKRQLNDEMKAKEELQNQLLLVQDELAATKNLVQQLHQEKEQALSHNQCLLDGFKNLDSQLTAKGKEYCGQTMALMSLFRLFPGVVQEQETPADKIRSVIAHIRTHGIQRTSESTSGKEKLESKIAELEKTVESLRETLRREGYHYSSPFWIRKGDWAISNRKMKLLEKQVQELQQEVERLKGNTEGARSDASLLDDTLFGKCLKSPPKPPECQSCEDLKKQIAHLKDESGTKSLRISTLTMKLDNMDSDYKKIAENLEKKLYTVTCENNKLRRSLEAVEAEAKRQDMRRHEGTQTDQDHVPWEKLRAQGAGSKIVDNHWKDEEIKKLKYEKEKLKEVARELKKRIKQMEIGGPDVATTVQTTPCSSAPAAITPRRRAALQRLVRDSNKIIAERQQPQPCTHHQRSKENPCPP